MNTAPRHHLDPATLLSHAAGALSPDLAVVVDTHLSGCAHCRAALARAEAVGGTLLEQQQPASAQTGRAAALREAMRQRLAQAPAAAAAATPPAPASNDPDLLPAPLRPYFGTRYSGLKWRWMGPGLRYLRTTGPGGGTLLMLRIAPGRKLPVHGHHGSEITQILRGAYHDALGHFGPGDVADLDAETQHQPVTCPGEDCICVAALDAPLRYPGRVARLLQPLLRI